MVNVIEQIPPVAKLCISAWMHSTAGCEAAQPPNPWLSMWSPTSHNITVSHNFLDATCTCSLDGASNSTVEGNTRVMAGAAWPAAAAEVIAMAGPRKTGP
jgi:hypothetical protein